MAKERDGYRTGGCQHDHRSGASNACFSSSIGRLSNGRDREVALGAWRRKDRLEPTDRSQSSIDWIRVLDDHGSDR